jgi:hypothetical protein
MMNAEGMSRQKSESELITVFLEFFFIEGILLFFTNKVINTVSVNINIFITRELGVSTH